MTKPQKLEKGNRVKFTPIMATFPSDSAGKVFVFDGTIDEYRCGKYDHRLMDENGVFVMWADRRELRKIPRRTD
jgi:hypothetical protein